MTTTRSRLCSLRRAGRIIHPILDGRCNARRSPWLRLVVALAWSSGGTLRCPWSGGCLGGNDTRSNFGGRSDDGADLPGSILHPSTFARGEHSTLVARPCIIDRSPLNRRLTDEEIEARQKLDATDHDRRWREALQFQHRGEAVDSPVDGPVQCRCSSTCWSVLALASATHHSPSSRHF
jgi:hypothetical protein